MLKKILIGLAVIIGIILIIAAFQPDTYTVERKGTVAAPPAVVFAHINDFHEWPRFNPWHDLDTTMTYAYEGSPSGVGAVVIWTGKEQGGKGRMTIAESRPNTYTKVDMQFIEPFEGRATTEFGLKPDGAGTELTWTMTGEHNFFSKVMCLFMSMDKIIGEQYEKGFAKMNAAFPGSAGPVAAGPSVFTREFDAPREAVWNAWTKPEEHMKWWGPKFFTCPSARMDVRPGGTYQVAMRGPDGRTLWNTGTYSEVVPMERLVYTVQFADSLGNVIAPAQLGLPGQWPDAIHTTTTLEEVNGRTKLTLVEEGVPAEMRAMSEQGMNECLDKLAATLK